MTRDTTPTDYHELPRPELGDQWAGDWDQLVADLDQNVILSGPIADRPAASDAPDGVRYQATDQDLIYRLDPSNGWVVTGHGSADAPVPEGHYESLSTGTSFTDPAGVGHTGELADASDVGSGGGSLTADQYSDVVVDPVQTLDYTVGLVAANAGNGRLEIATQQAVGDATTDSFSEVYTSPDTNCHQGYTTDGPHHYAVDTTTIKKYDEDWTLQSDNTSPFTSVSTGVNHLGDAAHFGGKIYIAASNWAGTSGNPDTWAILIYDASDLSLLEEHQVSDASITELSGITLDPANDTAYCSDYVTDTIIHEFRMSDWSHQGTISLSSPITRMQGVYYRLLDELFFISSDPSGTGGSIYVVKKDGTVMQSFDPAAIASASSYEGVDYSEDTLRHLIDDGSGSKSVHYYQQDTTTSDGGGGGGGGGGTTNIVDDFEAGTLNSGYTGDTANANVQTGTVFNGSYALDFPTDGSGRSIHNTSGLDVYPAQGDTFRCAIHDPGGKPEIFFGVQDASNKYTVQVNAQDSKLAIFRWEGGSYTQVASTSTTIPTGAWNELEVDWQTDITATVYDSSSSEVASVTASSETMYTSGGIGFKNNAESAQTTYFDYWRLI